MLTQKELKKHFTVFKQRKNELNIHSLEQGNSRMVYKYLCTITGKNGTWVVPGFKPTGKLDVLKNNINKYIDSLEYDSEYYYPLYRTGVFEELIIHDYLSDLGFKSSSSSMIRDTYELNKKNIYGKQVELTLSIDGLDSFNELKDKVSIIYHVDFGSWVEVKVDRNVKSIKQGIDSILKPLFITDSVNNLLLSEKLENAAQVEMLIAKLSGLNIQKNSIKEELKNKLLELAQTL